MLTTLYIARYSELEHAVQAAVLITRNPEWATLGSDEMAILDLPEVGGGMFWVCDLGEVPQGRAIAIAIVKAGVVLHEPL